MTYPDTLIKTILRSVKTIAMVGASGNEIRPSYFAMMYLLNKGFKVIPVNPGMVGKEILESETMMLANLIATKPRATIKTGKEAFYRQLEMPLADAYAYASQVMTENMLGADACEGIAAFIEKRDPKWPI